MISKSELLQLDAVKMILTDGEEIELVVMQRRIGPGGALIFPKIIVATGNRIIIGSRKMMGIHKDFDVITYRAIRNVKLEHGLVSSTVIIASEFFGRPSEHIAEEFGKIFGLRYNDAIRLVEFIDKKISDPAVHAEATVENENVAGLPREKSMACRACGAKNSVYSNYCSVCGAKL